MKYKFVNLVDDPYYKKVKERATPGKIDFINPNQLLINDSIEYIKFGKSNLAPNIFTKLGREVGDHRAVLNSKVRHTNGSELKTDNEQTNQEIIEMNLHDSNKRLLYDEYAVGGAVIEIVTDSARSFVKIFHLEVTKCRLKKDLTGLIVNPNWQNRRPENDIDIPFYPEFTENADGLQHSVIYKPNYEPEFIYGMPEWYAGLRSVKTAGLTSEVNENLLEEGYMKDGLFMVPVESPEQLKKVQTKIDKVDSGAQNAGGVTAIGIPAGIDAEKIPQANFIDLRMDFKGAYMDLKKMTADELLRIHSWYRSLAGFSDSTGFDTNRINNEYEVALNTSIIPKQNEYLKIYNTILTDFGLNTEGLMFVNESPVNPVKTKLDNINQFFGRWDIEPDLANADHLKLIEKLLG